jgi:hypothetical protein
MTKRASEMKTDATRAMVVERVGIDSLQPDPANVRRHGERNLAAIVASLKRWGQQKPIVTDAAGVIRAGNGTWEAARRLGWTEIDRVVSDLSGAELAAFAIADNRTAELAEWAGELGEVVGALRLELPDLDVSGLAFDDVAPQPPSFEPVGPDAQGRLDQKAPVTCPKCGEVFSPP